MNNEVKEHPDGDYIIKFGKYKGKKLKDIPDSYLLFLWGDEGKELYENTPLKKYIRDNLDAIKANINRNRWYNKV